MLLVSFTTKDVFNILPVSYISTFGDEVGPWIFLRCFQEVCDRFDQIEHQNKLNEDMKSVLRHLAYASRGISGVSIIVSTANENLVKEILSLHGSDKICSYGTVADRCWTEDIINVSQTPVFQSLTDKEQGKKKFVEYRFYYKCWCAGLRSPTICTKSSLAYNA
jgi:hypothetical protein